MNVRKPDRGAKAFTLIELLVVIGIIAVIAAILFPVFFAVREKGRRTQCLSNERQLGIAILQYAADNNETLFVAGTEAHGFGYAGTGLGWAGRCYPYIKDVGVFRCPDDSTADVTAGDIGSMNGWAMSAVSYGFNSNLAGATVLNLPGAYPLPSVTLGQIATPARTVLLCEVSGNVAAIATPGADEQSAFGNAVQDESLTSPSGMVPDATSPSGYSVSGIPQYATGNMGGTLLNGATKDGVALPGAKGSNPRHGNGANYAACDGHVAWLCPEQISPGFSAASADNPPATGITKAAAGTGFSRYVLTFSSK